MSKLEIHLLHM